MFADWEMFKVALDMDVSHSPELLAVVRNYEEMQLAGEYDE